MHKIIIVLFSAVCSSTPLAAEAPVSQPTTSFFVSGGTTIASDYRFRGVSPAGPYRDCSSGVDTRWRNPTFGLSHVDSDISGAEAASLRPVFSKGPDGSGSIARSTLLVALGAAF